MVKHRQLACQVGAFGEFASESSMDLNNMIFSTGSTFIFGSWICEADNNDKLQSHLLEDPDHLKEVLISTTATDQLTRRFAQLIVSDSNQISRPLVSDSNSSSKAKFYPSAFKKPSSFLARFQSTTQNNSDYPQSSFKKSSSFSIWARQHGKILSGTVRKIFQSKIRDTTDRSSGGSRANDNIAGLYHPLAGFRS